MRKTALFLVIVLAGLVQVDLGAARPAAPVLPAQLGAAWFDGPPASITIGVPVAHAADNLLGVITSSGASTTNATTAVTFPLPLGSRISVQCRQQAYVKVGTSSVVATANDVFVDVGPIYDVQLESGSAIGGAQTTIAILPVAGSASCSVFNSQVR